MIVRASLMLLLLTGGMGDGSKEGRRANALYEGEQYEEAIRLYREGLAQHDFNAPSVTHTRLLNNLGAALHRTEDFENAQAAFDRAIAMATEDADRSRAYYNAGNNAFQTQNMEAALEHYKNALLNDPSDQNAKFNYEFVKRQMEEQQNQDQENQDQENQDQENQDQENQDQENQDQENQDQQQQDQEEQEQQDQQNQEQQDQQQQEQDQQSQNEQEAQQEPDPNKLSPEQAQRILEALENEEEQLLRQVQKMDAPPKKVEKDW